MEKYSYVTVLTNEKYMKGVLALWDSLRSVKSRYPFLVLCSNDVSEATVSRISRLTDTLVLDADLPVNEDVVRDNLGFFEKWNTTFFKLKVFGLTQFDKIIMLDADMIVSRNIDHLFSKPHMSCAFSESLRDQNIRLNSGLVVLEPSEVVYRQLVDAIIPTKNKFPGKPIGDQDVIKYLYSGWPNCESLRERERRVLPGTYNCYHSDIDAFSKKKIWQYRDIYVIHYSLTKPWDVRTMVQYKQLVLSCIHRGENKYLSLANLKWKKHYRHATRMINQKQAG